MQRPRREGIDSAPRTRSTTSSATVDVIVLTSDAALLATLREAAGVGHQFFPAASIEAAVEFLVGGRCGIFVIDVALVGNELARLTEKLQAQFPEVVLLATGHRNEQTGIAQLVANGRIYRFLHKPVSPARAELFLSAATRRYAELRQQESRTSGAVRRFATQGSRTTLFSVLGAVAIGTCGVWWFVASPNSAQQTQHADEASAQSASSQELDNALARAEAAFRAGSLFPPQADSAFDLYSSVLRVDPENASARAALAQIVASAERALEDALKAKSATRVTDALRTLETVSPSHPRLPSVREQLATLAKARSQPAQGVTRDSKTTGLDHSTTGVPAPTTSNIDMAKAFLAANQLVEPVDGNAFSQLLQARAAGEDVGRLQITATDLGTRLLNRAIVAVNAADALEARRSLDAAVNVDRTFETSLPDLDSVTARVRDLESTTQAKSASSEQLARVTQLRSSGQLIEPPGDNAYESLKQVLDQNASSPEVRNEQQRLSFALLENVRTALAAGDIDRADVLATRTEEIQPGLPQTRALREQIGSARAERDDRDAVVQAASLPRRRNVPAMYPREALLDRIEGWVDLEFVIDAEGVPAEINVKDAQPKRVFDAAATQALRQWRFEPITRDGAAQTRRATLRMEFKLKG